MVHLARLVPVGRLNRHVLLVLPPSATSRSLAASRSGSAPMGPRRHPDLHPKFHALADDVNPSPRFAPSAFIRRPSSSAVIPRRTRPGSDEESVGVHPW